MGSVAIRLLNRGVRMLRSAMVAVSALALAGCGSSTDSPAGLPAPASGTASGTTESAATESGSAEAVCTPQQTAPHPELVRQLPADFPTVTGWQPVQVTDQGRTREVSGVLRGEVGDLVTVRDNAADELTSAGYHQGGTDEEVGFEAEAEFEGPQQVGIKVRPLCRDYLVLSYTVRP